MSHRTKNEEFTLEGLRALWKASGAGLPDSVYRKRRVPLRDILTAPEVFQPRDFGEEPWKKKKHVEDLAQLIDDEIELDPITLFPVAGRLFVVDGHCRLQAYRDAGWEEKRTVPARVLQGSFLEALGEAVRENVKARLPLTLAEGLEYAWRLVLADQEKQWGVRELGRTTGRSPSTISTMRDAMVEAKATDVDPRDFTCQQRLRSGQIQRCKV